MTRTLTLALAAGTVVLATQVQAQQRYLEEIFTDAEINVTANVIYGTNVNFLTSNLASPDVGPNIVQLQGLVDMQQPIPAPFYDPGDASTALKVVDVRMDIYEPDQGADSETARPVVLYVHTGDALPPPLNGSPTGRKEDSTVVEMCRRMARRGYVAVAMNYRHGWNPLAPDLETRRGTLLNAVYRAIHDMRQCVRTLKANAAGANDYAIDPEKVIVIGEGTGGYLALSNATLDDPMEMFTEKFLPDPFDPTVSYIDTMQVGNIDGTCPTGVPCLSLYRNNGFDYETHFACNMGGAIADTTWLEPGDVPMVAFHTVFDPFAPFTQGVVIVPTTGDQVVPVEGSNYLMRLVNQYGNNASFANLVSDPWTDRARSLYGTTQTHAGGSVHINSNVEGLFPFVTMDWPGMMVAPFEEASPWQFWDPMSPLATAVVDAGPPPITAHQASLASNPNMSPAKARAYIDTIMGYLNPRIVCALQLGPCALVGIDENDPIALGVDVFPNPSVDQVTVTSSAATVEHYEMFDVNGRLVRAFNVNSDRFTIDRNGIEGGVYLLQLHFEEGAVSRRLVLE